MIVSYKYNYLFMELPRTGTTAIANELIKNYEGVSILGKHSTYKNFVKKYGKTKAEKLFIFSCIRNPMDRTVSFYEKLCSNRYNYLYNSKRKLIYRLADLFYIKPRMCYASKHTFQQYFKRYYKLSYCDWSILDHKHFDFVIKFKNIQSDFISLLNKMGIQPKRKLPVVNKTKSKKNNFYDYYKGLEKRAQFIFGPFMKEYNYSFPDKWNKYSYSFWWHIIYWITKEVKKIYWIYIKVG